MAQLKPGARLRSAACTTEVIVVKAPPRDVEVSCGGARMLGSDEDRPGAVAPVDAAGEPTLLGKRYTNAEEDIELLCTKAGDGSLAVDGEALELKDAKPLPSSD